MVGPVQVGGGGGSCEGGWVVCPVQGGWVLSEGVWWSLSRGGGGPSPGGGGG